ncbi:calcium-binding protein, partial [Mesorhizobium sp. CN5-321]|uniref:calcium-binding protein n=1 Tax=Mesorhizobium hunchu TaxID=3157708 RepID=UPI0032B80700
MTDATYTADAGSIAGFAQVMDALVVITSGDVSNAQTTTCTLTVETDLGILVAVFTGTDFVYDEDSSLAGGTITGVSFTLDNVHQGDITTSLPVSDALQAAIAEENGDYAAIEHFFMSFNWTYHGNDLGEVADSSDVVGDDIPFNPTGNDTIFLNGGDDVFYSGDGSDTISGGAGNDVLDGGNGSDTINGGDGNDEIHGGNGADILNGNADDDILYGDAGNDTIDGGDGSDELYGGAGLDHLYGGSGDDTLTGGGGNDTIDGGDDFDDVWYAGEGGGAGVTVDLAAGTATDTYGDTDILIGIEGMAGTNHDDVLRGDDGDNIIRSLRGNDTVDGRGGSDEIHYGGDHDVLYVEVDLVAGTGIEHYADGITTDTLTSIERIRGSHGNDTLYGDDNDNIIKGLAGDDAIDGRGGIDAVDYHNDANSGGTSGVTVNLATGTATDGFGDTDTLTNIEDVRGTRFDDIITGDSGSNLLVGDDGNDTINGGGVASAEFSDFLDGGAGNDTLTIVGQGQALGGDGDDRIIGETSGDVDNIDYAEVLYVTSTTGIVANLTATSHGGLGGGNTTTGFLVNDGLGGTDRISGLHVLTGSDFDDTIYVDSSWTNSFGSWLEVRLGAGNDRVEGDGTAVIRVTYGDAGGAVNVNLATGTATDANPGDHFIGTDTLIGVTQVRGSSFDDTITGDGNDNQLRGRDGNDHLYGGDGNDVLYGDEKSASPFVGNDYLDGGTGADQMFGGAGNDTYVVDNAGDVVDESVAGSDGFDRVQSSITLNLSDAVHVKGDIEMGVLTGSANVNLTGNGLDNLLIGNAGNNFIDGGAGNDTLQGDAGNDTLQGGTGADLMQGGAGNDTYIVDNAGDIVDETGSDGFDRVQSSITINLSDAVHVKGDIEMG